MATRNAGLKLAERLTADDPRFAAALDRRIAEMRRILAAMEPESTATALRVLRESFPDVPFDTRIRVLSEARP